MPKKLTNKTNFVVKETGRPVFELDGENVSEKSATIKVDDFYVNLPSIHGNMKYNEDELYDMLMNNEIKATSVHKKHSDAIKAAKERSKNLTIVRSPEYSEGGLPIKAHEGTIVYNQGGSGTGLPLQPPPQNTVTGEGIKDPTTGEAIDDQPTPDISETAVEDPDPNVINTDVDVETEIAINPETGKPFTLEELLPIIDKPSIDPFTTDPKTINPDLENPFIPNPVPTTIPTKKIVDESIQVKPSVGDNYKGDRTKLFEKWNKDQYSPFGNLLGGDNKLPKGHYFGPADGVHQYGTGPYAAETQAFLDIHYGGSFNNFMEGKIIPSIGKLGLGSVKQSTIAPKNNAINDMPLYGYMNKGGMTVEQQMNLFDEGGMKDDGMNVDPVSGNEIPPGSLAKEVRDDIPAQLSEGEYVVPADVVQYYGVKFFEDLRMEAKRGLAEMDATGRIGGEPMSMTMIAIGGEEEEQKERQKKALGGVIHANEGPLISPRQKEMNEITKAGSFNFGDAGVTGYGPYSALGQVNQQNLAKQGITHAKTFYHPELGSKTVWGKLVMVNGQQKFLPNPNYEEFTKSPWSEKPFTAAQPQTTAKKERDEPSALEMEARNRQSAESLKISAERLNLSPEVYGNLSFFQRFRLAGEEINAMKGQKVNQDKIDTIVNDTGSSFNAFDMFKAAAKFALMTATGISPLIAGATILGGFKDMIDKDPTATTTTPSGSPTNKKTDPKKEIDEDWSSDADEFNPSGKPPPKYSSDAGIQKGQEASASRYTGLAQSPTVKAGAFNKKYAVDESDADSFDDLNKGGLINKPKRTPKKPRGKGLGNRK